LPCEGPNGDPSPRGKRGVWLATYSNSPHNAARKGRLSGSSFESSDSQNRKSGVAGVCVEKKEAGQLERSSSRKGVPKQTNVEMGELLARDTTKRREWLREDVGKAAVGFVHALRGNGLFPAAVEAGEKERAEGTLAVRARRKKNRSRKASGNARLGRRRVRSSHSDHAQFLIWTPPFGISKRELYLSSSPFVFFFFFFFFFVSFEERSPDGRKEIQGRVH